MKVRLTAPDDKKLRHIFSGFLYSEVVCDERKAKNYVLADSDEDPIKKEIDGVTLSDRVADLEDAVVELAEIITEDKTW